MCLESVYDYVEWTCLSDGRSDIVLVTSSGLGIQCSLEGIPQLKLEMRSFEPKVDFKNKVDFQKLALFLNFEKTRPVFDFEII